MTAKTKKMSWLYWLHIAIGLGLMLGFPMLTPVEPITEVGMWVAGILLGMVYLWSTVDSIWPSLLGLLVLALCSGYTGDVTGYAAIQKVFMGAIGSDVVLTVLLGMILFGTIEHVGGTKYLAYFFMTRKVFTGRPYIFLLVIFFCSYIISGLIMGVASLLILWPFMAETLREFGYEKDDKLSWVSVFGIYLGTTLGQPMLPFKGATLAVTGAFSKTLGLPVDYGAYILYNIIMSTLLLVAYLLLVRFFIRPDVSKLKAVTPEQFKKESAASNEYAAESDVSDLCSVRAGLISARFYAKNLGHHTVAEQFWYKRCNRYVHCSSDDFAV